MPRSSRRLGAHLDIIGIDELEKKLKGIDKATAFKSLDKAVAAAGTQIVKNARARAPVGDGHLRKAIAKRTGKKGPRLASIVVGVNKRYKAIVGSRSSGNLSIGGRVVRPSRYAHLVEFGTGPHTITARGRGIMVTEGGDIAKQVSHPGQAPQPFLGPSVEGHDKALAIRALKHKLLLEIKRKTR